MFPQSRAYEVVRHWKQNYLCFRGSGWEYFPMSLNENELSLDAGRFKSFDRIQHSYTVDLPYMRSGERSFSDVVDWISDKQTRWNFAINRQSETQVSVRFAFSDPIAAVEFALRFSG